MSTGYYITLLLKVGGVMIFSILFFFFVGLFIIKWLSLPIAGLVLFIFLGIAFGFIYVYRQIQLMGDTNTDG